MNADDRWTRLRARAERALGEHSVASAVATYKAIVGPPEVPAGEPLAEAALEKLRNGEVPSFEELAALETVIRFLRPVLFSKDGELGPLPEGEGSNLYPEGLKAGWESFRTAIGPLVASVGRIETAAGEHKGTGFLVGPTLLATNRHVLDAISSGTEVLSTGHARVVFRHEAGVLNQAADIVPILGVDSIHPTLDLVLLGLPSCARPSFDLATVQPSEGDTVVAIGYPADDPLNNPLFLAGIYQGKYGTRCAALGEVLDGVSAGSFFHDCSTTQGSSGSPLLSLETTSVVGIHRSGFFMYRNEAVGSSAWWDFVPSNA